MTPSKLLFAARLVFIAGLLSAGGIFSIVCRHAVVPASTAIQRQAATDDWPAAEELLRGVAEARLRFKTLEVELNIDSPDVEPHHVTLIIDIADEGRLQRFEQLAGEGVEGTVAICDHDQLRSFPPAPSEHVSIQDRTETNQRRPIMFDPRLLGLATNYWDGGTLQDILGYDGAKSLAVLGKETLGGVEVWRVQAVSETAISTFWIEQATLRVHRRTLTWADGNYEVSSFFDNPDQSCPLPSRVRVFGSETGKDVSQLTFAVTKLRLDEEIPIERFSLAAMDRPPSTPVFADRTGRHIGNWNGRDLPDKPAVELPPIE